MNTYVTSGVQSVHHQHARMISHGHAASMMFRSTSKQVCIKRFRRSSMSRIFVSYTLYNSSYK